MKLGKQGEILLEPLETALKIKVMPTELNKPENGEKFTGEIIVQPHSIYDLWKLLDGRNEKIKLSSGQNVLLAKRDKEKNSVVFTFMDKDNTKRSKFTLFNDNDKINQFQNYLNRVVKNLGIFVLSCNGFTVRRVKNNIILSSKETHDYFLTEKDIDDLRKFILEEYLLKEGLKRTKGGKIRLDDDGNIIFRNIKIPKEIVKDFYSLILKWTREGKAQQNG